MSEPALRFKDDRGQDFPEWKESDFKEVSKINQGLQIPISERFAESGDNRHFYITNEFLRSDSKSQYFIANPPKSVLCIEDDILMTRTGNTGKVVTDVKGAFHNNFFKIDYDRNLLNKKFICEFLTLNKTQSLILKLAGTSTIPDLNHGDFYKIKIKYPSLPEQTKIANFLTAVDEKISQLTQKTELLAQYKKGVMQQIFSQELRFKDDDGGEFPEWEVKTLGSIATRVTRKNKENNKNVLTISAQLGLINQEKYFNKSVSAKDVTNYYLLHKGDFAYNKSYSNGYPMGAIKCLNRYEKGVVSTLYICFKFNQGIVNSFFEHYFANGLQNAEIEKVAQEGARNHGLLNIGLEDFFGIPLMVPSVAEQTKIANFLTAIDDKLTQTQAQLDAVKQYKQGLLQQMFV